MTPIISYKNYIKYASDKEKARKRVKRWILSRRMTISEAARSLRCSRNTIRKLLNENDLNYEARKAPHICPHKLSKQIEETIKKYHKESGYGADMLKLNYNLSHSTASIHRVLVENGFVNLRKKKSDRQKEINRAKKKIKAFEKWQFDTKYLTDIPNLVGPIYQGVVPKYEYTLRDMATGTTFVGFGLRERCVKDSCSFVALCLYHMQLHGIDTHYVTIQSDNGPEILGKLDQIKDYEIKKVIEDKFRAKFRTIPVRRPTFNSHVESFHGRVEHEVYDRIKIKNMNSFTGEMKKYILRFNTIRKPLKSRKTPEMIAKEYGRILPKCFYDFPVLFYDKINSNYNNPIFSPDHYLPEEVNPLDFIFKIFKFKKYHL